MHSLRMCCKILCQNLVVHPKCTLGGSTKFHAFHISPTYPPTPEMGIWYFSISGLSIKSRSRAAPPPHTQKWEFGILAFLDSPLKVYHEPSPPKMGIWDFSISGLGIKSFSMSALLSPPLGNGNLGF